MNSYEKLMQYSLRIIAKKRYTIFEMRTKLLRVVAMRKLFKEEDIEAVIARLIELNYLNDKRYLEDYVSDRVKFKPRGLFLLKRELKFKGIPENMIDAHFSEVSVDEDNVAHELLLKQAKKWEKYDQNKQKMRAYYFLYSKGFARDTIYKAVDMYYNRGCIEES